MQFSLEKLHDDISISAKKGFPILLSGAVVFFFFSFLPLLFPMKTVHLIWIFGISMIFPLGILLSKIFGIDILSSNNPLSKLGGTVAAPQMFFIPVFILVYMKIPEYLPFTIGLLGGSHFLPYMWIYKSKAYLFVTISICIASYILGSYFIEYAFTLVPIAISISFLVAVLLILKELQSAK